MRSVAPIGIAIAAYLLCSAVLFASPQWPVWFLSMGGNGPYSFHYWGWSALAGIAFGATVAALIGAKMRSWLFVPALFVSVALVATAAVTSVFTGYKRDRIIEQFSADKVAVNSLWWSLRNAPREYQFGLHAVAMKNCTPYAWSYREMGFYELPPAVAQNVVPRRWLADCGFERQ